MVLSQLLFLGGNKIPRQNLSPKKSIKTQLLINIIIYSMNPIPFIHPISKTQKTSNFSKVHLRGRFTQTTLKAAETSAPLVKEPAPRLGQGYAVMSVLTVIAWIITSILALARHPAVTWCLSGVTFFFLTEKYPCDFFKKSQANFQEEVVGKDVSFIPAIGNFFGLGLYGMKACFSRRKSCCDPMIMLRPHERLLEMMHWESLTFEVSLPGRCFVNDPLKSAANFYQGTPWCWLFARKLGTLLGKDASFRECNTLPPPEVLIIEGWKFHERKFFPCSNIFVLLTQKSMFFRALPKSKIPKLRSWRSPIQQQHTKTPRWSGYHYGTMFGGLRIWEDFWNPQSWL